jgi:hypothetical protein
VRRLARVRRRRHTNPELRAAAPEPLPLEQSKVVAPQHPIRIDLTLICCSGHDPRRSLHPASPGRASLRGGRRSRSHRGTWWHHNTHLEQRATAHPLIHLTNTLIRAGVSRRLLNRVVCERLGQLLRHSLALLLARPSTISPVPRQPS